MRRSMILGFGAVLLACNSEAPAAPSPAITGAYSLSTIDGRALPTTISSDGTTDVIVVSGQILLNPNYSFGEVLRIREIIDGATVLEQDVPASGSWTLTDDVITFHDATDNETFSATLSANTLTTRLGVALGSLEVIFAK
jgi:hypothetical protein